MKETLYFPIAGCGGIDRSAAAPYDRRWLVVDADKNWVDQTRNDRLSQISVDVSLGYLVVKAPGMLRLDIPLDVIEDDDSVLDQVAVKRQKVAVVDEGEVAATWVSTFLGETCRLVKVHPDVVAVEWP